MEDDSLHYTGKMYVKIFSKIFDSTIAENWQARVVFMDLLILADRDGIIDSTLPSISRRTNCPVQFLKEGIEILMLPDPQSRSDEDDGRRIELLEPDKRDWGWRIINYKKYRDLKSSEDLREKNRERVRRFRERQASCNGESLQNITPESEDASSSESASRGKRSAEEKGEYTSEFEEFWSGYPKKKAKSKAYEAWQKIRNRPQVLILQAVQAQSKTPDWTRDGGQYIPHPATWLNQRRWEDEVTLPGLSSNGSPPETWAQAAERLRGTSNT